MLYSLPSPLLKLCTFDYRLLCFWSQICEICTVSGNSDQKVTIVFRMLLCIQKRICTYNIELYMISAKLFLRSQQRNEILAVSISFKYRWTKSHIEQITAS